MKNEKGSIMVITTGFVLVFTLLGMASIHFAMMQNEAAEKQKASTEAFWLADGAIEMAKSRLPNKIAEADDWIYLDDGQGGVDPNRKFDVSSEEYVDPATNTTYQFKWKVEATGSVNGQERKIEAVVSNFNIPDEPITSNDPNQEAPPFPVTVNINEELDIEEVFNTTESVLFEESSEDQIVEVSEFLTVIQLVTNDRVEFSFTDPDPQILIVDARNFIGIDFGDGPQPDNPNQDPRVTIDGVFNGILYLLTDERNVELKLNNSSSTINGAVFLETDNNSSEGRGKITLAGDGNINFDQGNVDGALDLLNSIPGIVGENLKVIAWKEI